MARTFVLLTCALALLASVASAEIIEHSFHVGNLTVRQLCREQVITAVNGSLPGPTIRAREGDTLIIHVINNSPYNMTIHWHGVLQLLSAWADGPQFVTQCPILPGNSYTYKFTLDRQEGTLWWHAHVSWLRATVYGALIIRPRSGRSYPFPKPYREFPILLGEWWNGNVVDIVNAGLASGAAPAVSDAYTINGKPGDLYPCPQNQTDTVKVVQGKTYLLRIINAALNNQLFFKIANHQLTVVAVDAAYTEPYHTDVIVLAPGQTADVLLIANQPPAYYYMAAKAYASAPQLGFNPTTTTAILQYEDAVPTTPLMPVLPNNNDTATAHTFYTNLTSLTTGPHWTPVPRDVDEHMFVTEGLGLLPCGPNPMCNRTRFAASMNNVSFQPPSTLSMLEAFFNGVSGIYTEDFPDRPPVVFDYTGSNLSSSLEIAEVGTRVKKLRYNTTVEMVLQNTALIAAENHPIHLHGFNFYVLAQGFGNYNPKRDRKNFNLVNPQERNTIGVPVGGWAVIRFRADNPGVWLMHCHLDLHLPWGLATAFVVENGPTPSSTLPPPPEDLPKCQK